MAVEFILLDRDTPQLFPPSVQDYLAEKHLARFVVDNVDDLDLSHLAAAHAGTGSKAHHLAMLVALLFYGYAAGLFSSRKLARATYDSIAFRFIYANSHPGHRTIADVRRRILEELEALFVEILLSLSQMTTVNADRHDSPVPLCCRVRRRHQKPQRPPREQHLRPAHQRQRQV
jgi:transposase